MSGEDLARAALALVNAPFRLHGRDPGTGLDCVGVLFAALERTGPRPRLPTGYALRTWRVDGADAIARDCGLLPAQGPVLPGDVLLARPAACQLHLAVAVSPDLFVHAHAGRRRVVLGPLPTRWTLAGHWRLAPAEIGE